MKKISIVITTKNEESVIANLLESIQKQSYKASEVIIVDNHSSDNTIKIAKKFGAKCYLGGPERSAQRNMGVKKAKAEYVLIVDADMVLTRDVLRDLAMAREDVVVIPEKSYGEGFFVKFKIFEREFYVGDDNIESARFFNRNLFHKFKGYDVNITGPEDYDLPLRMKKTGVKIGRIKSYILHNEKFFNPFRSAIKKFYYASRASLYAKRHREFLFIQGDLVFRRAFLKNWKKLLNNPFLSLGMFVVRSIEAFGAVLGFLYGKINGIKYGK